MGWHLDTSRMVAFEETHSVSKAKAMAHLPTIFTCVVASTLLAIIGSCARADEEADILAGLESVVQSGKPSGLLAGADAICFNFNNARMREELIEATDRENLGVRASLDACGVRRTCCGLNSDISGVVAIVKDQQIRCVEVDRFAFLLERNRAACIKPSNLKVTRKMFATRVNPPGRQWFSKPGAYYFEIGEVQQ